MHTTNYYNTFIEIAADSPSTVGEVPPTKGDHKTIAVIQFEILSRHPYQYTSDDVLFDTHVAKNDIPVSEQGAEREKFFSKGQPCFRSSPLTKRYGWGIHSDENGKMALYAAGSDEYERLINDTKLKQVKAMLSKKA